ncbi:hypothetical protein ACFL3I_05035 [Pseudomonadota bacterium]
MNEYNLVRENESVVRKAAKCLAEDEHWSGYTDKRLWAKAIAMSEGASEKLSPAVSEKCVLFTSLLRQKGLEEVVDKYCHLRGTEILARIQNENAALQDEIKRVKDVHKLYIKHYQFDHINNTSRHSSKYLLVLLIVILVAVLLCGNGA